MPSSRNITAAGKRVVSIERKSVYDLEKRFGSPLFSRAFEEAVDIIFKCKGSVVVTGVGKSGIIAQKINATFNSTGTHSVFLHSADSAHGDLGVMRKDDVALIISKSGDTGDIRHMLPNLRLLGVKIISIVGNMNSELAKASDVVLDASVKTEACPHNLAPTSSTTVAVVLGDALAIALLELRGFTTENFALFHPGGSLGKRLLLQVGDIMAKGDDVPVIDQSAGLTDIIFMITSKRLGCTCVVKEKKVAGIITDGDLRRLLGKGFDKLSSIEAKDIMNKNPKIIPPETPAYSALKFMEENKIMQLIVGDRKKYPLGIIHMHRLVEEGL